MTVQAPNSAAATRSRRTYSAARLMIGSPLNKEDVSMITLQTGAAGPEVQVLQTWLAALNPNPAAFCSAEPASTLPMSFASANGSSVSTLAVTGVFDQDTAAAVTRFQCDNGVPTGLLGNVDYLTWWQLAQSARKQ